MIYFQSKSPESTKNAILRAFFGRKFVPKIRLKAPKRKIDLFWVPGALECYGVHSTPRPRGGVNGLAAIYPGCQLLRLPLRRLQLRLPGGHLRQCLLRLQLLRRFAARCSVGGGRGCPPMTPVPSPRWRHTHGSGGENRTAAATEPGTIEGGG